VRRFCDSPEYLEPLVAAIDRLEASPGRILDIGTGTGPAALELAHFLKTVVLGHHLERLPESEREHFAAMVAAPLAHRGELVVDYVRLNNVAKREVAA
jgi:trans-aconitate 2-methyltransferase